MCKRNVKSAGRFGRKEDKRASFRHQRGKCGLGNKDTMKRKSYRRANAKEFPILAFKTGEGERLRSPNEYKTGRKSGGVKKEIWKGESSQYLIRGGKNLCEQRKKKESLGGRDVRNA